MLVDQQSKRVIYRPKSQESWTDEEFAELVAVFQELQASRQKYQVAAQAALEEKIGKEYAAIVRQ